MDAGWGVMCLMIMRGIEFGKGGMGWDECGDWASGIR